MFDCLFKTRRRASYRWLPAKMCSATLNDVKHTILALEKQLMSTKYFLIYTHFAVGGKGLKNAYFHPSTVQNPHMF